MYIRAIIHRFNRKKFIRVLKNRQKPKVKIKKAVKACEKYGKFETKQFGCIHQLIAF